MSLVYMHPWRSPAYIGNHSYNAYGSACMYTHMGQHVCNAYIIYGLHR